MFDLDDEKLSVLAEVLSNKTSKKIIEYLADNEASEAEIVRDLKLQANTVNYNVKKLIESGLIEQSKNWFWSVKGKKVQRYGVANKSIIISPKGKSSTSKNVLAALLVTGIGALIVKLFTSNLSGNLSSQGRDTVNYAASEASKVAAGAAGGGGGIVADYGSGVSQAISVGNQMPEIWIWFLLGGIFALIIFMILNWRKF